jgi:phage tail tape-measure protein
MSTTTQESLPLSDDEKQSERDAHRDPLSGRAGAHPIGTGIGAAAGGIAGGVAAGAAIGTLAGPVGTALGAATGAAIGAVVGGLGGKELAENANPTVEHGFWRENYASRPYALIGVSYEEYAPAYQYGWESQARYHDKSFDEAESFLRRDWERARGASTLAWDNAMEAARDSWTRIAKRQSSK